MSSHPYQAKKISFATKHEKLRLIQPYFDAAIGCHLIEVNVDTDILGTFSGEIERIAPPHETAIQKARLGMKDSGTLIGIASEGTIGPDPTVPFVISDIEHLVLVDDENGIVISESFKSFDITATTITVSGDQDLSEFLKNADFPRHGLIVRPHTRIKAQCIKGITTEEQLHSAIQTCSQISSDGLVVIESDLRAMHSPSRQKTIQEVARLLAQRISQLCPQCRCPGWGRVDFKRGMKCSQCLTEKFSAIRNEILGCQKCGFKEPGKTLATSLDPADCDYCNP